MKKPEAKIIKGKEWYVKIRYQNAKGEVCVFKDRAGMNRIKNTSAKLAFAKTLQDSYNEKLKTGWLPNDEHVAPGDGRFEPLVTLLPAMLEAKKSSIRHITYINYRSAISRFVNWMKETKRERMQPANFGPGDAMAYADYIRSKGIRNKTFNSHISYIKLSFNSMVERDIIAKSPFLKVKALHVEAEKNIAFNEAQKGKLKEAMLKQDPDLWRFCKVIYHTFLRPQEILRIRVRDIHFNTNQIVVPAAASKNKRQLSVEIPESFIDELKQWWDWDKLNPDLYLFGKNLKPDSKPYLRNRVSERFKVIRDAIGGMDERHTMYAFKHLGNVEAYLAGIDVYDIMRQNRHSSLEQTMKYLRSLGLRPNTEFRKKAPAL